MFTQIKRSHSNGRKGPGVVLGRDGQFVLVHQGRSHSCVNPSHLLKVSKDNNQKEENEIDQVRRNKDIHKNGSLEKKHNSGKYHKVIQIKDIFYMKIQTKKSQHNVKKIVQMKQMKVEASKVKMELIQEIKIIRSIMQFNS